MAVIRAGAKIRALFWGLLLLGTCAVQSLTTQAFAEEPQWRHAIGLIDAPKYPEGFQRFDYVNPDAPKDGELKLSANGTFDTFNPVLDKGQLAAGLLPRLSMVTETLLKPSLGEDGTSYGLLAEAFAYPDDFSYVKFRLRQQAKWADGQPVTPEDVVFSLEKFKELNPLFTSYYSHVVKAEKTGEREVTFTFDQKGNKELPLIVGELDIVPKHWWEGQGPDGKLRDISKTTLEPIMGSGPYRIAGFSPGGSVRYELREDYWGKDLNVNIGYNNFKTVIYTFFTDENVEFEAFRAGTVDYWYETKAAHWATAFDFPAVKDGRIVREETPNPFRATGIMQAMVPNLRRELFKDERVREALGYAFDFEELNRTVFFNSYKRIDSFFWGTELASSGLPQGRELDILEALKGEVPADVFTQPYANSVGGTPEKQRDNLRNAVSLLKQAGYEIRGNKMVKAATGEPLKFEILLSSPILEVVAVPYVTMLRKIGIEASLRTVDSSQYINRLRNFDYDMTWTVWGQTRNPGNEQRNYWGSVSANQNGSRNYAGISDPAIDKLIDQVVFAKSRDDLIAATRALDRVLLAHHYVIPMYYGNTARMAYWSKLAHPAEFPHFSTGFPDIWWAKQASN
ncbi:MULTISPECIES: extracellular solute-binding protein [Rhizobium/Agrobacterium group]|uniref:extracellular solute-binding protein n=1 Tax=Rhizobium/Agrobacterium group TaxID=227290 RepID=UPI000B3FBCB5|nr:MULTISPECIES: extracellular solute-binding protein [Rhizobium/Agrobacterium group]MCF1474211.1 ABC transporter substrate-binding protein [Allorhizobium ampelinum]MCF1483151.1 ABC transporter substrate-binding protein [Allorhizobium ampelinum]MVA52190.1 ABC transporter substrate-binding protein [Agrobacterium vitis]NSZ41335.1 ABC transporter substrate-binding protein [Agrobacterium vitis]NTA25018.1 ABC transporter substrate-binding protein [Allorhizobium ampelinum]